MSQGIDIKVGASSKGLQTGLDFAKQKIRSFSEGARAELAVAAQAQKELADSQKEIAEAMEQVAAAQMEQLQLAKLRAQATGDDETAAMLQREITLREETVRIAREQGIADHEAYAIAQQKLALQDEVIASNKKRSDSNKKLLQEDGEVRSEMVSLAMSLDSSTDAADAAASAFGSLAQTFELGLGAAVAIAVGAVLAKSFIEARHEAEKLKEEIQTLTQEQGSADFRSLGDLQSRLEKLREKMKQLSQERGYWDIFKEAMGQSKILGGDGGSFSQVFARIKQQQDDAAAAVRKSIEDANRGVAEKAANENELLRQQNDGNERGAELLAITQEYEEKRGEAIRNQNVALLEQLQIQEQLKKDAVNKKYGIEDPTVFNGETVSTFATQEGKIKEVFSAQAEDQAQQAIASLLGGMDAANQAADEQADKSEERKEQEKEIASIQRESGYAAQEAAADLVGKTSKRLELTQREALVALQIADLQKQIAEESDDTKKAQLQAQMNSAQIRGAQLAVERNDLEENIAKLARETTYIQLQGEIDRMPASKAVEASKMQQALYEMQIADLAKDALNADELRKAEINKQTAALQNQIEAQKELRRQQFIADKKAGPHGVAERHEREREEAKLRGQAKRAEDREQAERDRKAGQQSKDVDLPWKNKDSKRMQDVNDREREKDNVRRQPGKPPGEKNAAEQLTKLGTDIGTIAKALDTFKDKLAVK